MSPTENPIVGTRRNRKRALLAVVPLIAIAAFDLALLLLWGLEPIWAFAVLPPMVFVTALAWIYFGAVESEAVGDDVADGEDGEDGEESADAAR